MKKIIGVALIALALGIPAAGHAGTGDSCFVANGGTCQFVAGPESDNVGDGSTTLIGGRGSWIAGGEWSIEMYHADDCSGAPYRTYSSVTDNNAGGLGGSNNAGGYYGSCIKVTAGDGFVLAGALHSDLLP